MTKRSYQALLWEISAEAPPHRSYVFGTMHVRDQRVFQRLEPAYAAITACTAFAAEIDLEAAAKQESINVFALPDGRSLDQLIAPRRYARLRRILHKAFGIDLDFFKYQQPIFISNLLESYIMTSEMPLALDQHLWQYAKSLHKHLLGIESWEEQVSILQQIPPEQQMQALLSIGRNVARYRQSLLKMADWYEAADVQKLYRAARRGAHGQRRLLLHNRNRLMGQRIAALAREQSVFCAIGTAHLAGQYGVLRHLKKAGYVVMPAAF